MSEFEDRTDEPAEGGEGSPELGGTETAPVEVGGEETQGAPEGDQGDEQSSEAEGELDPSSESTDEAPSSEEPGSDSQSESSSESSESTGEEGPLVGTTTEQQPGVGGSGDHPAPAVMRDESGAVHSAGAGPSTAAETAPEGDSADATDESHALSPEAAEELNQVHEPDQVETDRPDIGTPE